jgi:hypothetical protein
LAGFGALAANPLSSHNPTGLDLFNLHTTQQATQQLEEEHHNNNNMGQKGSRHIMTQGGGVDEEGFLADVVPGLPAWARRRGSLTTPEERLLEEEELDLLAAEVQRLVDGPLKASPHPQQQTTRRGLLHSLRSLNN